jgi:hypothetical protein
MARRNDAAGPREGGRDDFLFFSNLMEKYQPVVEDVAAVVKSVGGSKELNEFRPIAATLRERIRRFPWTQAIYLKKY